MYIPEQFKIDDEKSIHKFMKSNPFAAVISNVDDKMLATHMPIDCLQDGNYYGHFSLKNPQASSQENSEALVIFTGLQAYISPMMYASDFNVPTWNYSAVHCYGSIHFIDDETKVWSLFHELVKRYEGKDGWKLPNEEKFKNLTKFIRFFKFEIKSIEAKFKFNQNKSDEDIESVIAGLRGVGNQEAANFMERITNHQSL